MATTNGDWYDGRFMERLDEVPEANRIALRFKRAHSLKLAESGMQFILFIGEDPDDREHAVMLREEVVFMLQAACLSLSRIVPHPRSKVHRLSATWGLGGETEAESTEIRRQLESQGEHVADEDDFGKMVGKASLHSIIFQSVEGVVIEDTESGESAILTVLYATRHGQPYAYAFNHDSINAIALASLNQQSIARDKESME